jgi:hypothetical protein
MVPLALDELWACRSGLDTAFLIAGVPTNVTVRSLEQMAVGSGVEPVATPATALDGVRVAALLIDTAGTIGPTPVPPWS